jgi:hypothetical protein
MERAKKEENDGKFWFKKIGGGSLRLGGKIIKPGEIFSANPESIPKGFKDLIVPLEEGPQEEEKKIRVNLDITKSAYKVVNRGKSALWFDVVDANGKVINEKAMKKEQAEKLASDLSK